MFDDPFVPGPAVWFGDLVSTRRQELGCSQRDLADLVCGVSGRATFTRHEIARYERESRIPGRNSLPSLAKALRLPAPMLRQAAAFSIQRRRLAAGCPNRLPDVHPGYLVGAAHGGAPQPMLAIGVGSASPDE